ncbi:MAG: hypoxanthine phosphoribosyltransferase [Dehalococcoidales bacterium]
MDKQAKLEVLVSKAEIAATVKKMAAAITKDYREKNPLLIGILKGSFVFLADLIRQLDFPLEVEFVRLSSYGSGTQTSGKIKIVHGLKSAIKGRHVLVVEDIVDTGITLAYFLEYLKKKNPASLKLCALTEKPSRRRVPVKINYVGLTVPDKFIVGYGIDCNEKYRNLPDICALEE